MFVAAEPNPGQQALCWRFQVFGVTLCDKVLVYPLCSASHVKSNLVCTGRARKRDELMELGDGSLRVRGLESGVGREDMPICPLLIPRCLIQRWWHWR